MESLMCMPCPNNCTACNKEMCLECEMGMFRISDGSMQCVPKCPKMGFYTDFEKMTCESKKYYL
jgi:hypothetical protein